MSSPLQVSSPHPEPAWLLPCMLSFIAGYVDTVGFIAVFGLFTAHVTGNFVLIGAALVTHSGGLGTKLLALPVFVACVALATWASQRRLRSGQPPARAFLITQWLLLAAFMAAGLALGPLADPDGPHSMMVGLLAVAAMAVQNAASRLVFASLAPTTVMTGNVTQLVIDAMHLRSAIPGERAEAAARVGKFLPPILAFAIGGIGGALAFSAVGFWAVLAPLAALIAAMFDTRS
jgi:uncharacterized membrane protein YoaK (UPF0700 family)